ncbi:MAG: aspartate aminotransferase family protein [Chloroflexota bacterium]|nr:aspartate aminotransferase family protein [Chloroflexota bacterium]
MVRNGANGTGAVTTPATSHAATVEKYRQYVTTSFVASIEPVVVARAEGATVWDADGTEYLDCFAGIAVVNAGHRHPKVVAAVREQLEQVVHAATYLYHVPVVADLAEALARITPGALSKTFFGNSGAEGIETAMRLAKAYTGRHEFITLTHSFHGRSAGTLSITGNKARKTRGGPYLPGIAFAPAPYVYRNPFGTDDPEVVAERCAEMVEWAIAYQSSGDVAAFIAEPVMGEGGILVPPASYFRRVKEVLDRHGILFIADEVQSGFGRTGKLFAIEHYGVEPDIMVLAKGIADGFPLSAAIARPEIADSLKPGEHLSTFGGNPISCAAGLANVAVMLEEELPEASARKGARTLAQLGELAARHDLIGDVRGAGLMIGVELVTDRATKEPATKQAAEIRKRCREAGVLVGVGGIAGNVVRFQPPLTITEAELDRAVETLDQALGEVGGAAGGSVLRAGAEA